MKRRSSTLLAVAVTVLITAAAIAAIFLFGKHDRDTRIILPQETAAVGAAPDSVLPDAGREDNLIEVTPQTVQTVVATLERPGSYSRRLGIDMFWSGGSSSCTADVWVRTGEARIALSGSDTKNVLVTEDNVYIWYDTDEVFRTVRDSSESLFRSADAFNMIMTYEDVLALPKDSITEARYDDFEGEYCIFISAADGGYENEYVISVGTGLLVHAVKKSGGETVYEMTAYETTLSAPDEAVFELPSAE